VQTPALVGPVSGVAPGRVEYGGSFLEVPIDDRIDYLVRTARAALQVMANAGLDWSIEYRNLLGALADLEGLDDDDDDETD
jgi:hypothetical protein